MTKTKEIRKKIRYEMTVYDNVTNLGLGGVKVKSFYSTDDNTNCMVADLYDWLVDFDGGRGGYYSIVTHNKLTGEYKHDFIDLYEDYEDEDSEV